MADGKWITGLEPTAPLDTAARQVLATRLRVVADYLPRAVHQAHRDPEHVHQLRVATRRADAAVRLFAACLPEKAYRTARRRLRRVRRAAGAARDWDVFLITMRAREEGLSAKDQPGFDFLAGYASGQRRAAQVQLEAAGAKEIPRFDTFLADTVAAVRPPHEADLHGAVFLDLARPLLSRLLHDLELAAAGDLEDYAHLHQVRITGKRLRYAMEVFAGCFGAAFREDLYPRVEEMQEILGHANDSHVAAERLTALRDQLRSDRDSGWSRLRPAIAGLLRFHQRRLPQERRRFLKWWDSWRKHGSKALLDTLLSGVASHSSASG